LTYSGALHHAMNRGHGGEKLFSGPDLKKKFIEILFETSRKLKIGNIAYCLLDNHYHLVVENSSGRLSEFFKQLNGRYGIYYRKKMGGKGYVFQSRFKSEIIQDDFYLTQPMVTSPKWLSLEIFKWLPWETRSGCPPAAQARKSRSQAPS
jgi:REP element-mobilizing transposase RayT